MIGGTMIGRAVAHYRIVEWIGEGGMGAVYKARDTHLDRFVAIKVLSSRTAFTSERLGRFVQEAKSASALNHPNIITVHDIGEADGVHFMAMEYVAGRTLDELLGGKGLPLPQALKYAVQIAAALAQAHAAGIVHRDLKPANIMVTAEGHVKVLDFGLAKLTERTAGDDETATLRTAEGTILGTAAYMSPEQAQGREVDARSDIFSFGSMLYEMAAGRRPFRGDSAITILGAIIHKDPEPVPESVPRDMRKLIVRCLQKDPARRFQHMEDLKVELEEVQLESGSTAAAAQAAAAPQRKRLLPWALAGILALVLAASWAALWMLRVPPPATAARFTIEVPQTGLSPEIALAPDGSQLIYSAVQDGKRQLFSRRMDRLEAQPIPGTVGATHPAFSSDAAWLFFADGKAVRKTRPAGGESSLVLEAGGRVAICPEPDGSLLYAGAATKGLIYHWAASGGAPEVITKIQPGAGEYAHAFPELLPGGKGVLFTIVRPGLGLGKHSSAVMPHGAPGHRVILEDGYAAHYTRSGQLVFCRPGSIYAVPFDLGRMVAAGASETLAEDATLGFAVGGRSYALSDNGTLAYLKRDPNANMQNPVWVDRRGAAREIPAGMDEFAWPTLSPDGRRLALVKWHGASGDVWVWDLGREVFARVTFQGNNHAPVWSPDGASLVVSSDQEGPQANLWRVRADGSGKPERLTNSPRHQDPACFSPDGKLLVFGEAQEGINTDILVLHLERGKVEPFLATPFAEILPVISPDGRWLAYSSNESGRNEVYVQRFPSGGSKFQVSTGGGLEALWAPDGKEIYYRNDMEVMAATVNAREEFSAGKPRLLFKGAYAARAGFGYPNWDISRDGKQFIMLRPYKPPVPQMQQIEIVLNWTATLQGTRSR